MGERRTDPSAGTKHPLDVHPTADRPQCRLLLVVGDGSAVRAAGLPELRDPCLNLLKGVDSALPMG